MRNLCLVFGVVFVFVLLGGCLFVEVSVLASITPPEENVWTEIASMHHARSLFGTVVVDGKIYVIGGLDESYAVGGIDYHGVIDTVEQYDPQTNTWTDMSPMPTPRYRGVILCSMGKIFCIGGSSTPQGLALGVNEVYDPVTNQWEQKSPIPTPRIGVSACVLDGRIYVLGGSIVTYDGVSYPDICEVYDPVTDTWYGGSWPDVSSLGMVFDNREYVWDDSKLRIHDLVLDSWVDGPDLPGELYGRGVVAVDGLLYALGGYTKRYSFPFYMEWATPERTSVRSCFVYTPFGYGRIAPEISVLSLEDGGVYDFRNVTLESGLKQSVVWVGYSLDGHANVTVDGGGVVLSGLSNGRHSVRVFAEDKYGNMGASETITFTVVNAPLSMFFITVVTAIVVVAVFVCGGLLLFLFLRKRRCSESL